MPTVIYGANRIVFCRYTLRLRYAHAYEAAFGALRVGDFDGVGAGM